MLPLSSVTSPPSGTAVNAIAFGNDETVIPLAPALPLTGIEQKELKYFMYLAGSDQDKIRQRFPTCATRLRALGAQLDDMRNAGLGTQCRISGITLQSLSMQCTDDLARGTALMQALPSLPAIRQTCVSPVIAARAYEVLLLNASTPRIGYASRPPGDAATLVTLATGPGDLAA